MIYSKEGRKIHPVQKEINEKCQLDSVMAKYCDSVFFDQMKDNIFFFSPKKAPNLRLFRKTRMRIVRDIQRFSDTPNMMCNSNFILS